MIFFVKISLPRHEREEQSESESKKERKHEREDGRGKEREKEKRRERERKGVRGQRKRDAVLSMTVEEKRLRNPLHRFLLYSLVSFGVVERGDAMQKRPREILSRILCKRASRAGNCPDVYPIRPVCAELMFSAREVFRSFLDHWHDVSNLL